jgi:predicted nucleic acid-binding protein
VGAESLDRGLGERSRALIDSSAIIAYHSSADPAHELARHIFGRVESEDDRLSAYFCAASATELLVRPIRSGQEASRLMTSWLREFPHLLALDVTLDVALQAATLRAVSGLKTPDALIIASGMLAGCEVFITNDKRSRDRLQPLFSEFAWVYLSDYL